MFHRSQNSFCRCLQEEKLKEFSGISSEKKFNNKKNIFLQQDEAKNIYNITEGNVKIYQLIDDGRIQIIGFLYPGDFFGSYKNGKYNYCAEAIGDVRVCIFEQKKLDQYIEKNMILAKELLNQTSFPARFIGYSEFRTLQLCTINLLSSQ